jgi:hypothetical protein
MATRPKETRGVPSQIDWPTVGIAGSMAGTFVVCLTLTAWVAGRGFSIPCSGFVAGAARSFGDVRSHAERGKEGADERGESQAISNQPVAVYPETIARETSSGPGAGGRGSGRAAALALTQSGSPGSAGYAGVPASPSRSEREVPKPEAANEPCCQVEFARDPAEAALLAKKERKLMFVLHVSGNFEESKFT